MHLQNMKSQPHVAQHGTLFGTNFADTAKHFTVQVSLKSARHIFPMCGGTHGNFASLNLSASSCGVAALVIHACLRQPVCLLSIALYGSANLLSGTPLSNSVLSRSRRMSYSLPCCMHHWSIALCVLVVSLCFALDRALRSFRA